MRAVIIGAVESTRTAIEVIGASAGWQIAAIITLPLADASRHSDFVDVGELAGGAEVIRTAHTNAPEVLARLTELAADVVFVIGWSQLCRPAFLAATGNKVVGYHPAPLPRLRGRGVIPWTILLDEPISAGTLFWIDEGTDTGPILAQRFFHVAPDETAASLYARHLDALRLMLADSLTAIGAGQAARVSQDERCATWAARRVPDDGRIDWQRPAIDIARLIRAVGRPYPGAFATVRDEKLTVWSAELVGGGASYAAAPGQVVGVADGSISVKCGDGQLLRIVDWECPSGRPPVNNARLG